MADPHSALADALRALLDTTVRLRGEGDGALSGAADQLRAIDRELRELIPDPPPPRYEFTSVPGLEELFAYDFVMGERNPVAAPIRFQNEEHKAVGIATFGTVYEGPPGCVHGAVIAAVFDQVLNIANLLNGTPGPTVRLEMDFRKPTPLHREIRFEAICGKVDGKRIYTTAKCSAGDVVTVEAHGTFAAIDVDRITRMGEDS